MNELFELLKQYGQPFYQSGGIFLDLGTNRYTFAINVKGEVIINKYDMTIVQTVIFHVAENLDQAREWIAENVK